MIYQVKDLFDADVVAGHLGFFNLLARAISAENKPYYYTTVEGNPYTEWLQSLGEESYKGMTYEELDYNYLSHSGEKPLRNFVVTKSGLSNEYDIDKTSQVVVNITRKYAKKWCEQWDLLFLDYNPIENYSMTETLTNQVTEYEHGHIEEMLNGRVNTRTGDVKETPGVTTTETHSVKGFDSNDFVGSDQDVTGHTGYTTTEYEQLKDTLSGTDKTTHSGKDTETKNYTLTRAGNIGVTTSQQMAESSRKLLMFDYFDQIVFPDIDKEIALQVYLK